MNLASIQPCLLRVIWRKSSNCLHLLWNSWVLIASLITPASVWLLACISHKIVEYWILIVALRRSALLLTDPSPIQWPYQRLHLLHNCQVLTLDCASYITACTSCKVVLYWTLICVWFLEWARTMAITIRSVYTHLLQQCWLLKINHVSNDSLSIE